MTKSQMIRTALEHHAGTLVSRAKAQRPPDSRILLLSELFPPAIGGSAVLFHGIYSRVSGAEVTVLTDAALSPAAADEQHSLRVVRRQLTNQRRGILDPRGLLHYAVLALQVRKLLWRQSGVVHCARAIPEGMTAMLSRLTGGPRYVCWAHGEDLATARTSRELTWLTTWVYRWADAAIANSRNTAALLTTFGVPETKIEVVYPAVDAGRFHPDVDGRDIRRRYAGADDILFLSVGRLQRRKGHDVAIQAVARLAADVPQIKYVIAGDGEERARLERLVDDLGVRDRVVFAGVVAADDLPAHYAACDAFLMPNRVDDGDIEGFGIVFLEAAATGKPAIGGDSGGVPEAVERDRTGLLVDGASVDSVAAAMRTLAQSASLRQSLGAAGRVRAIREFSWQRAAEITSRLQARTASSSEALEWA